MKTPILALAGGVGGAKLALGLSKSLAPDDLMIVVNTGDDEDFHGLDVGSMHLITAADQSEELIYELTRTIYENREKVVEKHAAGRAINPANVVRDTGTEFHPGAVRFYREIGIWSEREASR